MDYKKALLNQKPQLDAAIAAHMLENVFEACQIEPNSIPLEVLASYSNYRKERFAFQKGILIVIFVCFCLLPFLFISPKYTITESNRSVPGDPVFDLKVDSVVPVRTVRATIDGLSVPVYEITSNDFSIEPNLNGEMHVTVTLINKQYFTKIINIGNVDETPPHLVSNDSSDNKIFFYVDDDNSGIDFQKIRAVDTDGSQILPLSYDVDKKCVVFQYPTTSLNIFVPDNAENTLQLVLTLK